MEKLNLHQKLIEIRKCVPYLMKNKTGYNYRYVSGTSVLGHIQNKMNELSVLLYPGAFNYVCEIVETEYREKKVKEYFVKSDMNMTWQDADNPEDKIEIPFLLFGKQDDPSKAFGSGLTYSERYFLLKFFNIPTDEIDPDSFQDKIDENIEKSAKSDNKKFIASVNKMKNKILPREFDKICENFELKDWEKLIDREIQKEFYLEIKEAIKIFKEQEKNGSEKNGELPF